MQFYIQTCPPHLIPRVWGGEGFLKQKNKKTETMIHLSTPLPRSEGASLTSQPYDNLLGLVQVHHMPHHNNRPCGPLDLILQHLLNMLRCYILALIHKQTPSSFVCTKPFDIPIEDVPTSLEETQKDAARKQQTGYLVEGYNDGLTMHQHGYTNTVGTCGTALTAQQVRLLKPYTKHIVVLFDGDAPGQKAAVRAIDVLLAGGMVVDVVRLPKGVDPAEFLLSASSTSTCVEDLCEDFVGYILGCIPAGADVPVKVAGQKRVIEAIAKISDHLYRRGCVFLSKRCRNLAGIRT